jgi:hypothetical protein
VALIVTAWVLAALRCANNMSYFVAVLIAKLEISRLFFLGLPGGMSIQE